jgi:hypothetical protein
MAVEVVHRFETVQVDEQQSQAPAESAPSPNGLFEVFGEQGTVGQSGQWVVERLVAQLLLEVLLIGDVTTVEYQATHARLMKEVGDVGLEVTPRAVTVTDSPLGNHFTAGIVYQELDYCAPHGLISGMNGGQKVGP